MASRLKYMTSKPTESIPLSRLRNLAKEPLEHVTIGQQGPVELAVDAFKLVALCSKFWEEDVRYI